MIGVICKYTHYFNNICNSAVFFLEIKKTMMLIMDKIVNIIMINCFLSFLSSPIECGCLRLIR